MNWIVPIASSLEILLLLYVAMILGGNAFLVGGTGGSGLGGLARINVFGGLADLQGDVNVNSNAAGGIADEGTGGNAQSGRARVVVDGGALDVGADLTVNSISTGGSGVNGGDAIAFIGTNPIATATSDARVIAGNGTITVGGFTSLNVSALGGAGSNGGTGGDAAGGFAVVNALNRDAGEGTITLGDLGMNVTATGGAGGTGVSGNSGGNGGAGGSATGGWIVVTASAGNGHLDIANVTASVSATGGAGGNGGDGDAGLGGNGGVGGGANGGFVQIGTESGIEQALSINDGTTDISSVVMLANATGGNGGNGGFSPAGSGAGGDGGGAGGGTAVLLVRGSELNVGPVSMTANATGGDGGTGSVQGNGGDAESDEVVVLVTNRAGNTAQRGTLNAGSIIGTSTSTGGSGATAGASMMEGGSSFIVENSDATIGSLDFTITAAGQIADLATDMIAMVNSQVSVAGAFNFDTDGVASVFADDNTPLTLALTAGSFNVSADNFVHDPDRTFQASVGTISANTFAFTTNGDLIIDANLVSTSALNLVAPGLIDIEDATSGSDLTLDAGGSISGGTMTAAGLIDATAGGDIGLNLVNAGTDITMLSTGGSILSNAMSAGGLVDLFANVDVSTGDITRTARSPSWRIPAISARATCWRRTASTCRQPGISRSAISAPSSSTSTQMVRSTAAISTASPTSRQLQERTSTCSTCLPAESRSKASAKAMSTWRPAAGSTPESSTPSEACWPMPEAAFRPAPSTRSPSSSCWPVRTYLHRGDQRGRIHRHLHDRRRHL